MIESGMRLRAAINLVVATLVLLCAMGNFTFMNYSVIK